MIKANFKSETNKFTGPVIIEGSNLKLLFELNSIIKTFMKNDSKEILHAVFAHNLESIKKQYDELDRVKFDVCLRLLEKGEDT